MCVFYCCTPFRIKYTDLILNSVLYKILCQKKSLLVFFLYTIVLHSLTRIVLINYHDERNYACYFCPRSPLYINICNNMYTYIIWMCKVRTDRFFKSIFGHVLCLHGYTKHYIPTAVSWTEEIIFRISSIANVVIISMHQYLCSIIKIYSFFKHQYLNKK